MENEINDLYKTPYNDIQIPPIPENKILGFYEKYMTLMGVLGHFIFILQTYKIIINKNASDVSLEGFCISFLSIISWLLYGVLKKDRVLVAVNIFGAIASLICIITIISLR